MSTGSVFGVFFTGRSFPIPDQHFVRVDATHFVLDVATTVTPQYWELQECALFLTGPHVLDPTMALALYVKAGNSEWMYRGCVHNGHPSDAFPLQWPPTSNPTPAGPGTVQLGVSLEPLATVAALECSKLGDKQEFAKRVGMDLFRFLESFSTQRVGDAIVMPTDAIDRWFKKFQDKFRRDPDFLTRASEKF